MGSHSEGYSAIASGEYAHAEGTNTVANGTSSHTEGRDTRASGENSHAEGFGTVASHFGSHSEGYQTRTSAIHQHVGGQYNADNLNALFIIGNGNSDTDRKNSFEVLYNGTIRIPNFDSNNNRIGMATLKVVNGVLTVIV